MLITVLLIQLSHQVNLKWPRLHTVNVFTLPSVMTPFHCTSLVSLPVSPIELPASIINWLIFA